MPRVRAYSLPALSYGKCPDKSKPLIVSEGNFTQDCCLYLTLTATTGFTTSSTATMMRDISRFKVGITGV
jgi:hypothetical protein